MNVIGRLHILLGASVLSLTVSAQTTNTTCTTYNYGPNGQVNCTSTTQQPQQQSQAGQEIGTALGGAIGRSWAQHQQVKNYCKFHPGEAWHDENYSRAGVCKVPKQK
jgi:phosphate-selective porin